MKVTIQNHQVKYYTTYIWHFNHLKLKYEYQMGGLNKLEMLPLQLTENVLIWSIKITRTDININ